MFEDVDGLVDRLTATAPPGPGPGTTWVNTDPVLDPDGSIVAEIVAIERAKSALDARAMVRMAQLCTRAEGWVDHTGWIDPNEPGPADLAAAELAPALHLTPTTAALKVDRAQRIVNELPETLRAYARGDLDLGRVFAIDTATACLDPGDPAKVEALVLPRATEQTAGELRAALARAVITIDPTAAEKRRKEAVKDRYLVKYTDRDGMSIIKAALSAVDAAEIYDLIDQIARQTKTSDDTRSMDAKRADAMVLVNLGRDPHLGPEDEPAPAPTGPPPAPPSTEPPPPPGEPTPPPGDDPRPSGPGERPGPDRPAPPDPRAGQPVDQPAQHAPDQEPVAHAPDQEPLEDAPDRQPVEDDLDAAFDDDLADLADALTLDPADPDDPGPVEPADPDTVPPDYEQGVVNQAWRDHQLGRLDTISELAALALSAMTTRRPPKPPWVTVNTTTSLDGSVVQVGELQGYGPVTADYANHLLTTGAAIPPPAPSGREPTPAQTRTHDPPDWLAHEVKARDGTCRYPGCRQPAHRVDLDHTIPFPRGLTIRTNLGGLCRRHHRIKGTGCWTVHQHHDHGIYTWTSTITGRAYTTYPRGTAGEWRGATTHP